MVVTSVVVGDKVVSPPLSCFTDVEEATVVADNPDDDLFVAVGGTTVVSELFGTDDKEEEEIDAGSLFFVVSFFFSTVGRGRGGVLLTVTIVEGEVTVDGLFVTIMSNVPLLLLPVFGFVLGADIAAALIMVIPLLVLVLPVGVVLLSLVTVNFTAYISLLLFVLHSIHMVGSTPVLSFVDEVSNAGNDKVTIEYFV